MDGGMDGMEWTGMDWNGMEWNPADIWETFENHQECIMMKKS